MSDKKLSSNNVKPDEPDMAIEATPKKSHHKGFFFPIFICVIVLLLVAGFGFVLTQRSFHRVSVGGVNVSSSSTGEALIPQIEQIGKTYTLAVSYPDGTKKQFSLESLGLSIDAPASAAAALSAQKPQNLLTRAQWWRESKVPLVLVVNEKKFNKALQNKITRSSKKPTNAKIAIKNGRATLAAEKTGVGFTVGGGREAVLTAIENSRQEALQAENQDLPAAITKAEAQPVYEKVQAILKQNIVIRIDGRPNKASASTIGKWIELTPVPSAKTIDLSVNSGKVLKYINSVAAPYVQPPRSEVVLKQSDGSTKILVPGKSGIDVVRKNELASKVAKKALVADGVTESAAINYASFKRISARSYPKWLVVDVTNKRMYAYENTRLVRTFLISAGAPGTPTVLGQYAIRSKVRIQDMRGNNVDGSRYFQPDVEYVNYFYADYAIHGNYWRPTSYFGNVNSSHGCVGIVNSDAAWVYTWAPIGTPVIVHS